jgi:hypothetical protein
MAILKMASVATSEIQVRAIKWELSAKFDEICYTD